MNNSMQWHFACHHTHTVDIRCRVWLNLRRHQVTGPPTPQRHDMAVFAYATQSTQLRQLQDSALRRSWMDQPSRALSSTQSLKRSRSTQSSDASSALVHATSAAPHSGRDTQYLDELVRENKRLRRILHAAEMLRAVCFGLRQFPAGRDAIRDLLQLSESPDLAPRPIRRYGRVLEVTLPGHGTQVDVCRESAARNRAPSYIFQDVSCRRDRPPARASASRVPAQPSSCGAAPGWRVPTIQVSVSGTFTAEVPLPTPVQSLSDICVALRGALAVACTERADMSPIQAVAVHSDERVKRVALQSLHSSMRIFDTFPWRFCAPLSRHGFLHVHSTRLGGCAALKGSVLLHAPYIRARDVLLAGARAHQSEIRTTFPDMCTTTRTQVRLLIELQRLC